MENVKVYRWYRIDPLDRRRIPGCASGTLAAIEARGGIPKMETERTINASWLDEDGFYKPLADDRQTGQTAMQLPLDTLGRRSGE